MPISFKPESLVKKNVKCDVTKDGLQVTFEKNCIWPYLDIKGDWDLSPYTELVADITNENDTHVFMVWEIFGVKGRGKCRVPIRPGETKTAVLRFYRRPTSSKDPVLHGLNSCPPGVMKKGALAPKHVRMMRFLMPRRDIDRKIVIRNIRARNKFKPFKGNFFPVADTFGQFTGADWPSKIHSLAELKRTAETEKLTLRDKPTPKSWNQYGGWKDGPQLKATGRFRTAKIDGKWTLVDPEGRLFFSMGINSINLGGPRTSTPLYDRVKWFKSLPSPYSSPTKELFTVRKLRGGAYSACFSFSSYNLIRKYGHNWQVRALEMIRPRMHSWGMNTVGHWSDSKVCTKSKMPYVTGFNLAASGCPVIGGGSYRGGKMWDVFDPRFRKSVTAKLERIKHLAMSPWCIGVFLDNELAWSGWADGFPGDAVRSKGDTAAKQALLKLLQSRYKTPADLGKAWGMSFSNWNDVLKNRTMPSTAASRKDMDAFYSLVADTYFRTMRDIVREVCPGTLYLGCRFSAGHNTPRSVAAAAKYCDVISFNLYYHTLDGFQPLKGLDAPMMITEFHFGSTDRGMFGGGLYTVENQVERAADYRAYVKSALKHPGFVGCHWFQYRDLPLTGEGYSGENYGIGFISVVDVPYPELTRAARDMGENMYKVRWGNIKN